jgi:hypothetical protein
MDLLICRTFLTTPTMHLNAPAALCDAASRRAAVLFFDQMRMI